MKRRSLLGIRESLSIFFQLTIFTLLVLLATSCGKSEPENTEPAPSPQPADKIELATGTNTNPVIPTEGSTLTISFNASTAWSAEAVNDRADAWCSVSPTTGNAGAGSITITTKENTDTDERSASVIIKAGAASQTIKITQKQKDALTVTASTFEVPAEGQDINIEVKANVGVTYKIAEDSKEWIKHVTTKAIKTSTLTFAVSKNENLQKREGQIIIGEGTLADTIKIFQAGETPSIVLNKNEYIAKSEGETFAIDVASNVDVDINILHPDSSPTWLEENSTKTMSTNTYWFTASANEEYDSREAKIIFTNKENSLSDTVKVTQLQKDGLVIARNIYEIDNKGGNITIEVAHNIEYSVGISADWITQVETKALDEKRHTFAIAENDGYDNREAIITFSSADGTINQEVKVCQSQTDAVIVSQKEYILNSDGGNVTIEIRSNADYTVANPECDWIHEVKTKGLSTHTLQYKIDENNTYDSRSASIIITNSKNGKKDSVVISQMQKDAIVLAKREYEFGADGGNLDFEIQTNVEVTVTVSDNAKEWIQQIETRGLESKMLYFNIAPCTGDEEREGVIIIDGGSVVQSILVTQSGLKEILEKERAALVAFYKATGGDNWINNTNWCSDKPVSEWYGVHTTSSVVDNITYMGKRVASLSLSYNNLTGSINGELDALEELEGLSLGNNNLSGIKLGNKKLTYLNCWENKIRTLDISKLESLEDFYCFDNQLTSLDISDNANLINLACYNNAIQSITFGNNSELLYLNCLNNPIKEINTTTLTNLKSLSCADCQIAELDLSNCDKLVDLFCYNNKLTSLDLSHNRELVQLDCADNPVGSLDLGNNAKLEMVSCYRCNLKSLNVSSLQNLQRVMCGENELENIDVSNNPELGLLWCGINNLSTLDVSNNPKLYSLVCGNELNLYDGTVMSGNNRISILDLSNNPNLEVLGVSGNKLTELDLSNNHKLRSLELHSNSVRSLDLSKNGALEGLYYAFNNCESLNVTNSPLLKQLECSRNSLTELDLSNSISLNGLYCSSNKLKVLDISYSYYINTLSCENNPDLTKIYINKYQSFRYTKDSKAKFVYKGEEEPETPSYYESTDYSKDGQVKQIQAATSGKGIDIVLMGDAFSDRLIADGTYDRVMNTAMEKFFMEEPYKSFRNLFNVYTITVVSKNEVYEDDTQTALDGYFGGGTRVGGNDQEVFTYTEKAIGDERIDNALIVVMMNSDAYAGTCYMYYPSGGDWGNGISISYFPTGEDENALAQVLHHEAGGHGFSKLGDEYEPQFPVSITQEEIESAKSLAKFGWFKNVDFTDDPQQVKWKHFLTDERYANEGLGIYEGSYTYTKGAYRPSWNSIMRHNTGGFNAPSREAIYYRIHKLAYGAEWTYDYEKFVEWDAKNRTSASSTSNAPLLSDIKEALEPLHPPVIVNTSWRNAKNNSPKKSATRPSNHINENSKGYNLYDNGQTEPGAIKVKTMQLDSTIAYPLKHTAVRENR